MDPERRLLAAIRWAVLPGLSLPLALATLSVCATGEGPPWQIACPFAILALICNAGSWLRVISRWRALPKARPEDDGHDWWRWSDADSPLDPDGGAGGVKFDWPAFERDFWAHVEEADRRARQLVHASGSGGALARPDRHR